MSFNSFAYNGCTINDMLESMEVDVDINTSFELKTELRKNIFGGTLYEPMFFRYLEELNPYFKTDSELTFAQVAWVKQLVDSGNILRFRKAIAHVKINPKSSIPELDANYAIGVELSKFNTSILDHIIDRNIKVIATHDNVTTYWTHLDGVPVRGHPDGATWNTIEGAGAPPGETEIVIALKQDATGKWVLPNGNHGSKNIVLHEASHAIDRIVGQLIQDNKLKLSLDPNFYRAWYNDYTSGNLKDSYYTQPQNNYEVGLEESFAEGLAKYFIADGISHTEWPFISEYIRTTLVPLLEQRQHI